MKRRDFLKTVALSLAGLKSGEIAAQTLFSNASTNMKIDNIPYIKPNILFIFADDQCYKTLAALGNDEVQTPNLDRLVNRGVIFTHAYNQGSWTGAVCVASRTMLNTGRFLWNANSVKGSLSTEAAANRLWSKILSNAGYETYMTGKWHIGITAGNVFDNTTHIRGGMPSQTSDGYNRPIEGQNDPWSPYDTSFGGYWAGGKHWSEVLGDDAEQFISQAANKDKPFFMYLAFNAPHDPRQSPKEYVDKYPYQNIKVPESFLPLYPYKDDIGCGSGLRDERLAPFPRTEYAVKVNRQEYYAIITHMDAQVGRILDALDSSGKADNTYIFFTADHGLALGHHGLIGKQNMFDPSLRVPLIVCGPRVPKNKKIDTPVYLQDIMPSTIELAGAEIPPHVQFKSLMPLIKGQRSKNYDAVYGAYLDLQRMVCKDNFKLIMYPQIKKYLLFNLADDPMEMNNLAGNSAYQPVISDLFASFRSLQTQTLDSLNINISEYSAG